MGKSEKSAFILITALLVLLIGFILVRALTSHDAVRVYRVSIITDDVQGDYSANVLKGLDRAARDYNIDLQVIALHSGMTTEQQRNSLERELESETNAIILNLQQNPSLSEQLDLSTISVPIISLGTAWGGLAIGVGAGIALGAAVSRAQAFGVDTRIMFSAGLAAQQLGLLGEGVGQVYAIPVSISSKSPFFDRG